MESVNRTFELCKESIKLSPSSIFSTEDVTKLIEQVKQDVLGLIEEAKEEAKDIDFKENVLQQFIVELHDNRYGEYIDHDSAEFKISYNNRIELSNIDIDLDEITSALERAFDIVENNN